MAAGQQHRPGKPAGLNPGQQSLTERFRLRLEQKCQNKARFRDFYSVFILLSMEFSPVCVTV